MCIQELKRDSSSNADGWTPPPYLRGQGVSYSQKFCGKCSFPNLSNSWPSEFMFSKYLIECQNVKIVKSKFKIEKSNKNKCKQKRN